MDSMKLAHSKTRHQRMRTSTHHTHKVRIVYHHLLLHVGTSSMVSVATAISKRHTRQIIGDLENAGLLWRVDKKKCEQTGHRAWYYSTDPMYAPVVQQLSNREGGQHATA